MTLLEPHGRLGVRGFTSVCHLERLTPDRGVAALVEGVAVALFLLSDGMLHAIDDLDPCSGARVLSRGIIGEVGGAVTVASPMYKHRFELVTGRCLDRDATEVRTHDVRVVDGVVQIRLAAR